MHFPVTVLCRVMQVSTSAYYAWKKRPGQLISVDVLHLPDTLHGIGSALIKTLEEHTSYSNCQKIVLDAREPAVGFYQKLGLGYRVVKKATCYLVRYNIFE